MQPTGLPDDVLVLQYETLATDGEALARLKVLKAIGRLLSAPADQDLPLSALTTEGRIQAMLRAWFSQESPSRFWQLRDDRVRVLQACDRHILIGTRQLLADLSSVQLAWPLPSLIDLAWVWQAAIEYTAQHIGALSGGEPYE